MQSPETKTTSRPKRTEAMLLIMTMLDTTWRAFVPTLGGTLLGIFIDKTFSIIPAATIVCVILGFVVSGVLIALQIKSVRRAS